MQLPKFSCVQSYGEVSRDSATVLYIARNLRYNDIYGSGKALGTALRKTQRENYTPRFIVIGYILYIVGRSKN